MYAYNNIVTLCIILSSNIEYHILAEHVFIIHNYYRDTRSYSILGLPYMSGSFLLILLFLEGYSEKTESHLKMHCKKYKQSTKC